MYHGTFRSGWSYICSHEMAAADERQCEPQYQRRSARLTFSKRSLISGSLADEMLQTRETETQRCEVTRNGTESNGW